MNKVTDKLYNWASVYDEGTIEQAKITSSMNFVSPHLSLMPDAHLGKGSTVGSVVPTKGAIMPACVGVDIGCGMIAVKTTHTVNSIQEMDKKALRESIESQIPLSAGKYNHKVKEDAQFYVTVLEQRAKEIVFEPDALDKNWRLQLGSLGSGNHFIEITKDEEGFIWLFLHSGSRGIGNKIAMKHIKIAKDECKRLGAELQDPDLAFLIRGTLEFQDYIDEMNWAQDFAQYNREVMMKRVVAAFTHHAGAFQVLDEINCHHNFTQRELHDGEYLWVTRKGAISANLGQPGLIPGSMGTASYVVEGLGNPMSFNSAPHGAGRNFSRATARKTFTKEDLDIKMQGIEWSGSNAFIDEHPDAYKDIDVVMKDAEDLVVIKHTLNQLINIKGD